MGPSPQLGTFSKGHSMKDREYLYHQTQNSPEHPLPATSLHSLLIAPPTWLPPATHPTYPIPFPISSTERDILMAFPFLKTPTHNYSDWDMF